MRAIIIYCLICVLMWFSILAIVGFMTWLRDRKRGKGWCEMPEKSNYGKFECSIKIKELISMLLELGINRKADIYTNDENNIVINITDMRGEEE